MVSKELIVLVACGFSAVQSQEQQLLQHVMSLSSPLVRPVINMTSSVMVTFFLRLKSIVRVHEKEGSVRLNFQAELRWRDELRTWDQTAYGYPNPAPSYGYDQPPLQRLQVPSSQMWTPQFVLQNSAKWPWDGDAEHTNVEISSDGGCWRVYPMVLDVRCPLEFKYFPFDEQKCRLEFESYAYTVDLMDLEAVSQAFDVSGVEWRFLNFTDHREATSWAGMSWRTLVWNLTIRREYSSYIIGCIVPMNIAVVFSFCTFAIAYTAAPARVFAPVIAFLTITSLHRAYIASLPRGSSLTWLDRFAVACAGFAVVSLILSLCTMRMMARIAASSAKADTPAKPTTSGAAESTTSVTAESVSADEGLSAAGSSASATMVDADNPPAVKDAVRNVTIDAAGNGPSSDAKGSVATRAARMSMHQTYHAVSLLDDGRGMLFRQLERRARKLDAIFGSCLVLAFAIFEIVMFAEVAANMEK